MATKELRTNERIKAPRVRLVGEDGNQIGVVAIDEAIEQARGTHLDLVEVAPQADPPVCRIMDYGRYKYEHKHKREAQKKHRVSKLKELRLHLKTEKHDIEVRLRQARRFLERGDRVLVNMVFRRGREMAHADLGRAVLNDFAEQLGDISQVEKHPSMENRRMGMILVRKKRDAGKRSEPEPEEQGNQTPEAG